MAHLLYQTASPIRQYDVFLSSDEERRLFDLRVFELRGQFVVTVDIPIPIERPAKTTLLVLGNIVVEIFLSEPGG